MFVGRFYVPQMVQNTLVAQHFGGFFHQIKVSQRIGRKDTIKATSRKLRRLEAFFLFLPEPGN
jgi:hypothetical protein